MSRPRLMIVKEGMAGHAGDVAVKARSVVVVWVFMVTTWLALGWEGRDWGDVGGRG